MKVAELVERRRFRLGEHSIPDPGPGQVQVRVDSIGVCGSDLHYYAEGAIGDTPCVYPAVLGHEPTGRVLKLGSGVTGWAPGALAALEPAIYCYHCEFCLTGRHNVCDRLRFLSQPGDPGFFRELVNLPAENLLPLPTGLSAQQATLFEPLAVVLHSLQFAAVRPGEKAAVFGAGPIGLMTALMLKLSGAARVWVIEPVPHRRELALEVGADAALDPTEVPDILRQTGGGGVDVAIDCAARGPSIDHAIALTRNAGRLVVTGIPCEPRLSLDFHTMRRKELAFYNVRRSNHDSETALELLRQHRSRFAALLTHEFPIDRIQDAFEILEGYHDGVGKIVIRV